MTTNHFPDEIISRPRKERNDELLVDHAKAVAERMIWLGQFESEARKRGPSDEEIVRCLGWLHDFGKVAPAFQQYVRPGYPDVRVRRYTYHARLGAFAVYYALGEMDASECDRLAAWAAVLRHHGRLPDVASRTLSAVKGEQDKDHKGHADWAGPQIEQIRSHEPSREVATTLLETATDRAVSWDGFVEAFESDTLLDDLAESVTEGISRRDVSCETLPDDLYGQMTQLWSHLTFADKTAAGGVDTDDLEARPLELDGLENYVETLQQESGADELDIDADNFDPTDEASLNVLRETARQRVRTNAPQLADAEVGTLTLPTGLGKTFTGITGAFELRDTLTEYRDRETKPTVVYALPYTSIIEQTRDIFEDRSIFDADPRSNEFTVHHYLAETVTYIDAEEDVATGEAETDVHRSKAELLGESWRSGVVLTTFVQLFESLAGPTNAQGLKLPSLQDAVIILDEPQALPIRWWDAIRRLTRLLLEEYDVRIISMTATQPTLFTEGEFETRSLLAPHDGGSENEPSDSIPDSPPSFERRASEAVARVQYDIHESIRKASPDDEGTSISHTAAAAEIANSTCAVTDETADGRSVLAVCNTIGSSRELTECLEAEFRANGHPPTHVGAVYESVLKALDTDSSELPDHEHLAARTLHELGFERDVEADEWYPTDGCSGRRYVATFNSRYRPLDRRVLIRVADELSTAGVPFTLVSTQAIEAGVDISFARAYRDIAPLDSVVQTAGRCNRSFEWGPENGEVTVWMLGAVEDDDSDEGDRKPPSNYVYNGSLLSNAAEILLDLCEGEPETLSSVALEHDAVSRYFDAIEGQSLSAEELVEMIDQSRAEELGRHSLIDDSYETVDLIVAVTETDLERIAELGDAFERHASKGFDALSDLADLRVSIPVRYFEEFLPAHIRADRSKRTDGDGLDVFVHQGTEGYGSYKLDGGGFVSDDGGGPSGRFTL